MSQERMNIIGLSNIVKVLRGYKDGRKWQLIVVNRELKNNPKLINQLVKCGVEVINCGKR